MFEEQKAEPVIPGVQKTQVNQVGEAKMGFNQDMLLEEIFAGLNFGASTEAPPANPVGRVLSDMELSSIMQVEVERGSDLSAPYSQLGF